MPEVSVSTALGGQFEAKFRALGITYTFVEEFPLDDITIDPAVQVRQADIAPKERVARYKEQMAAGATFPPITIRKGDNALLDGNTRVRSAGELGRAAIPAYVVEPRNRDEAIELGGALNQLGGKDLEPEDAKRVALIMARRGKSTAVISKELGVQAAKVTRWLAVEKGAQHAAGLGLSDSYGELSQNQQELLSKVRLDDAFTELTKVLSAQKPVAAELQQLVKRVNEAGAPGDAVEDVRRTAMAWPEADGRKGNAKSPAMAAVSALDKLTAQEPDFWVDVVQAELLLEKWEKLRAIAEAVVAEYLRALGRSA